MNESIAEIDTIFDGRIQEKVFILIFAILFGFTNHILLGRIICL